MALPGVKAQAPRSDPSLASSRALSRPSCTILSASIRTQAASRLGVGKIDMAQGTNIGLESRYRRELDLPPERVSMVQAHTDLTTDQGGAFGSTGIWKAGAGMAPMAAPPRPAPGGAVVDGRRRSSASRPND